MSAEAEPAQALSQDLGGLVVAGLDEAGRGPLAGSVVSGCVVLASPVGFDGLSDSKKLSDKKRDELYALIFDHALAVGIGIASPSEIDELNILRASLLSMARAFSECQDKLDKAHSKKIAGAVIDGNQLAPLPDNIVQRTIIKGDSKSPPIMAASIIAKVTRDRQMLLADEKYPGYGFAAHKGYPTKRHQIALEELGVTPIHRRSFAPVRKALQACEEKSK